MTRAVDVTAGDTERRNETIVADDGRPFTPFDWGLLGGAAAMFGSSFLFMAEALEALAPALVTSLRLMVGFVVLSLFPSSRRAVDRAAWSGIGLLAVVWFAAPLSLFPLAQQYISSSLAGMLNGGTPIAVALVASVLHRRPPGPSQVAGLSLGAIGIVLIALPRLDGGHEAPGVLLGLGAVACYGLAFNVAAPLQRRYGSVPILWRALAVASVLTAPFGAMGVGASRWDTGGFAAAVAVGVLGTGLAYVATATLSGRVGGTRSATITYVATPISVLLGVGVRGEDMTALSVLGAVAALAGAALASMADRRVDQGSERVERTASSTNRSDE